MRWPPDRRSRFPHAKPGLIRALIAERTDPLLVRACPMIMSAIFRRPSPCCGRRRTKRPWPRRLWSALRSPKWCIGSAGGKARPAAACSRVWLDALDETGRWALLKLITGALRIGVSARLAKPLAVAATRRDIGANDVEEVWHGLAAALSRSLRLGRRSRGSSPIVQDPAPFCPAMLAHAIEDKISHELDAADFACRMEMGWHPRAGRHGASTRMDAPSRLYSRTGEDVSAAFPDLVDALA